MRILFGSAALLGVTLAGLAATPALAAQEFYAGEPVVKDGLLPPKLYRHIDKATGVPPWWTPIKADWTFRYPSKTK